MAGFTVRVRRCLVGRDLHIKVSEKLALLSCNLVIVKALTPVSYALLYVISLSAGNYNSIIQIESKIFMTNRKLLSALVTTFF